MSLTDWLKNGWLVDHETRHQEIADLLGVVRRDLENSRVAGLSPDWQLAIAYNAALQVATAALAAAGYRCSREAHHYRIIQSLEMTIGLDRKRVAELEAFRKKRNISDYERAGGTSQQEAAEMIALAEELEQRLRGWLESNHPDLLFGESPRSR
jgi:hypothetical protein